MTFQENITTCFKKYKIELNVSQCKNYELLFHLLVTWNEKINLTSITDERDVIVKHFLDSVLPAVEIPLNATVIDIGCGAGFPSLALKILRPDLKFTLVDSVNKKLNFINEVINILQLKDINVIHSRSEDLAMKKEYREQFDVCLARAVAETNTLSEYCLPFVKLGGKFLAYKSQNVDEEILKAKNAIKLLGGKLENVLEYNIEGNVRKVLVIKKIAHTQSNFPRGKNKPRLSPLN